MAYFQESRCRQLMKILTTKLRKPRRRVGIQIEKVAFMSIKRECANEWEWSISFELCRSI